MQRKYWETEYRKRGKLWRGSSREMGEITNYIRMEGRTLDAGCGNGKDTPPLENIIGLDFSRNALKLYPLNKRVQGDITSLPFKSSTFSNILFIHSLDHLLEKDRKIALNEAHRILQNGGKVVIKSFSINDFRYGKGKEIEPSTFERGNRIHTHYFNNEEFDNIPLFKLERKKIINYNIIIKGEVIKREEIIIILIK